MSDLFDPFAGIKQVFQSSGVLTPDQQAAAKKASLSDLDPNKVVYGPQPKPTNPNNPLVLLKPKTPQQIQDESANPVTSGVVKQKTAQEIQDSTANPGAQNGMQIDQIMNDPKVSPEVKAGLQKNVDYQNWLAQKAIANQTFQQTGAKPEDMESGLPGSKLFEGTEMPMQGLPDENGNYPDIALGGPTGFLYNQNELLNKQPKTGGGWFNNLIKVPSFTPNQTGQAPIAQGASAPQGATPPPPPQMKVAEPPEPQNLQKVTNFLNNKKGDINLGDILDIIGVAFKQAGGNRDAKTRRQQQYETDLQKQNIEAQGEQEKQLAQVQGDITRNNTLATLDPETDARIREAIAAGNNEAANKILVSRGTLPDEIKKIMAAYEAQMAMSAGADPGMAGYNAARGR